MMQPKRTKFRKQFKGHNRGIANRGGSVAFGELSGMPGSEMLEVKTEVNVQGEEQKRLDVISNIYFTNIR